jgi:hypothetical protein
MLIWRRLLTGHVMHTMLNTGPPFHSQIVTQPLPVHALSIYVPGCQSQILYEKLGSQVTSCLCILLRYVHALPGTHPVLAQTLRRLAWAGIIQQKYQCTVASRSTPSNDIADSLLCIR